jgi:hypothetical protein
MEQVNCALPLFPRVFVAQVIRKLENIRPADPGVNQQPGSQILFNPPKSQPALVLSDLPESLRVPQSIAQLNAMERIESQRFTTLRHVAHSRFVVAVYAQKGDEETAVGIGVDFHLCSVSQRRPKGFGLLFSQFPSRRLVSLQTRCPIHFAAPLRLGGRKCSEGHAVARDCHLLAAFNPLCYVREMIPQVAHGCRFHRDTSVSHNNFDVNHIPAISDQS